MEILTVQTPENIEAKYDRQLASVFSGAQLEMLASYNSGELDTRNLDHSSLLALAQYSDHIQRIELERAKALLINNAALKILEFHAAREFLGQKHSPDQKALYESRVVEASTLVQEVEESGEPELVQLLYKVRKGYVKIRRANGDSGNGQARSAQG